MDRIKDALSRFLRAGMRAEEARRMYGAVGLNVEPLWAVFNNIYDGLCILTGDEEKDFGDTVVDLAMTEKDISEEERLRLLMEGYRKNRSLEEFDEEILDEPEQPIPNIIDRDEMQKQVDAGYGYMARRMGV